MITRWTQAFDMTSIPDDVLMSEFQRRRSAKRETYGAGTGRPKIMRPCSKCGVKYCATDMRPHLRTCTGKNKGEANQK
jgi:hypothetical protein